MDPPAGAASFPVPRNPPIDILGRQELDTYIEQQFQAAMRRRREYVEKFKQDTGMELDATRRDSVHEETGSEALIIANNEAINLLLEAWYQRLGIYESGFTKYSEKTTPSACMTMRRILEEGDKELGIPIEALKNKRQWTLKLKLIKWWFFGPTSAFDFLSAFGIGDTKIGHDLVRIEVLNFANQGVCVNPIEHHLGLLAWAKSNSSLLPNRFPPGRPCGCYEYKLLMKTIANAERMPVDDRVVTHTMEGIWMQFLLANHGAGYSNRVWPTDASQSNPARIRVGTSNFNAWFYEGREGNRNVNLKAMRLEGPWAEIL